MVRGDWVLFHPVYTTGEVKAVKVRSHLTAFINAKSLSPGASQREAELL
jgi:hypothetical protein